MSENAVQVGREIIAWIRLGHMTVVIQTKTINALLSATLLASSIVGTEILATDEYLWSAAPLEAIGLIMFTIVAIALAVSVWKLQKYAAYTRCEFLGTALFPILRLTAMIGDTVIGHRAEFHRMHSGPIHSTILRS